jgi:spore coat protein U-like protein
VLAADNAAVTIGATVLSKSNCKFNAPTSAVLAFGTINPLSNVNATASATLSIRCGGSANVAAYSLTHDSGLHETGASLNRMKHTTLNTFLPYSLTLSPSSGTIAKNVDQIITVSGTVTPANFQDANIGSYADTVVITLSP